MQQHTSAQRGLSLLELLSALLLTVVPVVAAHSLMFRTADSARLVADQMLARQAALSSYERIFAVQTQGLWPNSVLQSGIWWVALNTTVSADSTDALRMQCVNNWCPMNQWAAFELAAMDCALRGHFVHHEDPFVGTTGCQTAAPLDESFVGLSNTTELLTKQPIGTHSLLAFEAEMHAVDNLGIVVHCRKTPLQRAASAALTSFTTPSVDALTEAMSSDWYEVVVGQGP